MNFRFPCHAAQFGLVAEAGEVRIEIADVHREGRVAGGAGILAAGIQREGADICAEARGEAIDAALEFRAADGAVLIFRIAALFIGGEQVCAPCVCRCADDAAGGVAVIRRAPAKHHIIAKRRIAAVGEVHLLEDGVGAARKAGTRRDGADAAVDHDGGDQRGGGIVKDRVHQVRSARGDALAIQAQIHPLAKQAAILDLAGQFAIADAGGARCAGGEAGDVHASQRGGFGRDGGVRGGGGALAGDDDDVLQGRGGVILGVGGEAGQGEGDEARAGQKGAFHERCPLHLRGGAGGV